MPRHPGTTRTYRPRFIPTAILAAALAGLLLASCVQAAPTRTAEPQRDRMLLAMMDEMGKGGAMGGMTGGQPGGAQMGGGAGGMSDMCCMGAMGKAPGAGTAMAMPSALPGFPGASHLYHVGAGGLFLDHADKLGFSLEQTTALNSVKQRVLVEQSAVQRKIDEAEQALWMLTAADQPDATAIEAKLREIEKLKSDERLAFIRAVGEAAKVLNGDQRKMVLGMAPMPSAPPAKAMTK